ncbi:MAG: sigma-70 family RNA polymerase sigma factor [Candidatus Aminicenantales bacterium]|jgi:RNA polymerase sigma factor (sigma-70 family)
MNEVLAKQNSAMEEIVKNYGALIKGAVYKSLGGDPCSDDILSEVYFAILLTLRKLGAGWTPPRSFIYAVIRNKVNDFLRQKYGEKDRIDEIKKHLADERPQREEVISKIHSLSHCEFQVFRLLGQGMTNEEMAQSLHVSLETIRSHIKRIYAKCGFRDRAKLALIAHHVCSRDFSEVAECGCSYYPEESFSPLKRSFAVSPAA